MPASKDSFHTRSPLAVGGRSVDIFRLDVLERAGAGRISRLPFSLKILVENLLRCEDGLTVTADDIRALASWNAAEPAEKEIAFRPARVLMQDFTGVPCIVDLAAMRDAIRELGGDAARINPLQPADLVIDHSVQVDQFGATTAFLFNARKELERNRERYALLRWGQQAFDNFRVVPPDTGIVHQVNLEYLASVVIEAEQGGRSLAYPDTLVGTDSHTTMVNGLAVLGWGVGGIEAEAAMLGQPMPMLLPEVIGFKLTGRLREGATATDLVLTVTEMLRTRGVVGKIVEFYGPGLSTLPLPDRATIANMAPEYGATAGFFPCDAETLAYIRFTGRPEPLGELVEAYTKEQGLFRTDDTPEPDFTDTLALDLGDVEPSIAGPKRPQDRVPLTSAKRVWRENLASMLELGTNGDQSRLSRWLSEGGSAASPAPEVAAAEPEADIFESVRVHDDGRDYTITHGSVVIAAITSCTNTSNPAVMLAAGLVARNAAARGLRSKPWVKTSLAPGSMVVTEYLRASGLDRALEELGFYLVGYGCTTCIGNSGPLPDAVSEAVRAGNLVAASVLSGNRNFEGRINSEVRANYLASPPLVVAYAIAGTMDIDLYHEPLGIGSDGAPVYLQEIWPTQWQIADAVRTAVRSQMFRDKYAHVFEGDDSWRGLDVPQGDLFQWQDDSTYIKRPPYFDGMPAEPVPPADVRGARVLALLGDSVTTDHISPAGAIAKNSPAGKYLIDREIDPADFNSYGSRRGNHEVMVRGTFANVRLRNQLAPGTEGGYTRHLPDGEQMSIFDAAERYASEGVPLIVLAGSEYGTGSSRDWAAKGTLLLGVRAVIAKSFERIHRSNLIGMGVLPLQFLPGEDALSLRLRGEELYAVEGIADGLQPGKRLLVRATEPGGAERVFEVVCRIDTPIEVRYFEHGGILPYVLRQLVAR
ncbi:MAG: aconitate hydratase AcnA [Dehalococcoidia bacterium]|nr:aconitate hydratase AcnA [Dehalococcoidia bacterium]